MTMSEDKRTSPARAVVEAMVAGGSLDGLFVKIDGQDL
jgi:hypothetical protein